MAIENSADQLVERIIRDAKIPKGSGYRDTTTLLGIADAESRTMVKEILRASGDYLVAYVDVPLTGKRAYRLPRRAIRMKGVELYDSGGVQQDFAKVDSGQAYRYQKSGHHWYYEDNAVVPLLSSSQEGGFLRMRYYRWPSRLVLTTACAVASSVTDNTVYFSALGLPEGLPAQLDAVKPTSPFETAGDDLLATSQGTGDPFEDPVPWTFASLPAAVEAGDWLCPAGATCFPQLPLAYHDALVTAVVARVLREMKDRAGAADAKADLTEKLDGALVTISPRDKESQVIANKTWF
jgi:hypothetical protein